MTTHTAAMLRGRHYAEAMRDRRAIAGLRAEKAGLRVRCAAKDKLLREREAHIQNLFDHISTLEAALALSQWAEDAL